MGLLATLAWVEGAAVQEHSGPLFRRHASGAADEPCRWTRNRAGGSPRSGGRAAGHVGGDGPRTPGAHPPAEGSREVLSRSRRWRIGAGPGSQEVLEALLDLALVLSVDHQVQLRLHVSAPLVY